MSGVPEVIKGYFEFSIAGAVLTVAAKGVTKVRFPKAATPGLFVTLDLTGKSYSFDTDSYPANAGCGITTTVDWANAMPWFVYLGNEDDTAANVFAFNTRDPRMSVTPAAGLINDTAAVGATAQSQNHINSWKADDAGIAAKPCICIGSHTMTWETDAAPVADVWELVALTTADGFGKFQEGVQFTYPLNQNGAAASTYLSNATPDPCAAELKYIIRRDGSVNLVGRMNFAGAGGHVINTYTVPLATVDGYGLYGGFLINASTGIPCFTYQASTSSYNCYTIAGVAIYSDNAWSSGLNHIYQAF